MEMNCLYDATRLCPKAHLASEFTVAAMKDHCLDCQAHELSTIHGLFKLKADSWTAEQKIRLALEVWEDGNINLLDLTDQQKENLVQIVRVKIPTFLQEEK
jgi:hypothetical protein